MGKEVGAIMSDYSPRFFSTNAHVCVSEFQSMTSDKKNHIFSSKIKRVTDNAHQRNITLLSARSDSCCYLRVCSPFGKVYKRGPPLLSLLFIRPPLLWSYLSSVSSLSRRAPLSLTKKKKEPQGRRLNVYTKVIYII